MLAPYLDFSSLIDKGKSKGGVFGGNAGAAMAPAFELNGPT